MSDNRTTWLSTVKDLGDGDWGWMLWPKGRHQDSKGGVCGSHIEALAAINAAMPLRPSEPPAPPAWMVEVAREVEEAGPASHRYAAVCALRLALERGHVVEPRAVSTGLELTELARSIVAAECDKRFSEIVHGQAVRAGQGDDGFGMGVALAALRTIVRGCEPRPMPSEEELLTAAREDAAQALSAAGYSISLIANTGNGLRDDSQSVQAALQARRNMLKEGAVAVAPAAPAVDLETALKQAWDAGAKSVREVVQRHLRALAPNVGTEAARDGDVSALLASLPTRETSNVEG